ncbi:protein translocase subunit SecF [Lysobacter sp. CA199]|uniref:protein translocase subunit SecF n=1 Tax=Lysobacter sp. CA199 TaxID=3455608 RepID=UPI003F8D8975
MFFPLRLVPHETRINFLGVKHVTLSVAVLMLLASIAIIAIKGYDLALEFTGGVATEVRPNAGVTIDKIRERAAEQGLQSLQVQTFGGGHILIRAEAGQAEHAQAQQAIERALDQAGGGTIVRNELIGPQMGRELATNGVTALLFVLTGFLLFLTVRFEWKFAVAASATLMFDLSVVAGTASLLEWSIDLTVIAGLLSVMGVSINDKIVVFDRVRENLRRSRDTTANIMNSSINQTLSRTMITSLVVFLSVLALFFYGGESLRGMSSVLMTGVVVATLSSIFVACPLLTDRFLGLRSQDMVRKSGGADDLDRRP